MTSVLILEVPQPDHLTCPNCLATFKGYLPLDGTRRPADRSKPAVSICEECMQPMGVDMRSLETWKLSAEEVACLERDPRWQRSKAEARRLEKLQTN